MHFLTHVCMSQAIVQFFVVKLSLLILVRRIPTIDTQSLDILSLPQHKTCCHEI